MVDFLNKSLFLTLIVISPLLLGAQINVPAKPQPPRLVNDFAAMMQSNEIAALEQKLVAYTRETSTQISVVTIEDLGDASIFDYAQTLATHWGIGTKENDNGVLLLVAKNNRRARIHTGYGSEGFLPDAMGKRIIDQILLPAFRQGNYYAGIDRATSAIMELGQGEYQADPNAQKAEEIPDWMVALFVLLLVIIITYLSNRGGGGNYYDDADDGGYYRGGRYDMPHSRPRGRIIIFPGGFGGGGGGFGSGGFGGGGGFGGFGGGGFGGGGAEGGW